MSGDEELLVDWDVSQLVLVDFVVEELDAFCENFVGYTGYLWGTSGAVGVLDSGVFL